MGRFALAQLLLPRLALALDITGPDAIRQVIVAFVALGEVIED